MPRIDYMKAIGVLGRTLKMETLDMKFQDASTTRLEITMGGPSVQEKKFLLSISDYSLELAFPAGYLQGRDLEKWQTSFEYELEQAYMSNVEVQIQSDSARHVVRVKL